MRLQATCMFALLLATPTLAAASTRSDSAQRPERWVLINDGTGQLARTGDAPPSLERRAREERHLHGHRASPGHHHGTDGRRPNPTWLDENGDGLLDLWIPVPGDEEVFVLRGAAAGFAHGELRAAPRRPTRVQDVDGDGAPDGGSLGFDARVSWADVDADGDEDLLVRHPHTGRYHLLERNGAVYEDISLESGLDRIPAAEAQWADVDDDGDLDLLLAGRGYDELASRPGEVRPLGAQPMSAGGGERRYEPPGETDPIFPMGDPPFDHGSELTGLADDDHARYLNTEADDDYSDTSWAITADTTSTHDKRIELAGGGTTNRSTGATVRISGNEHSLGGGRIALNSGDEDDAWISLNAFGATGSFVSVNHNADGGTKDEDLTVSEDGVRIASLNDKPLGLREDVFIEFEGGTDDDNETVLKVADPTFDRTITLPNSNGTVAVGATTPIELSATGVISCPTCSTEGTRTVDLDCGSPLATTGFAAPELGHMTDADGGRSQPSNGFSFSDTEDEEIYCNWTVAGDYDNTSGTEPQVRLVGWPDDCLVCAPGINCSPDTGDKVVELEVSSRVYGAGDRVNDATGTADTATLSWSSQSCGSPCNPTCFQRDILEVATADAGNWDPGDFVSIRILRDASATNDFQVDFHLTAPIRLTYPSTN